MRRENTNYWLPDRRARLSRRGLLKGGSAAGAGVAGWALIGCGDDDDANGVTPTPPADDGENGNGQPEPTPDPGDIQMGGHLRMPLQSEPPNLDPAGTLAFGLHTNIAPVYSRLIRTVWSAEADSPADFTIMPDLAEEWEQQDLQTYIFSLRQNATWHDIDPVNGRAVTAEDIVATIDYYKQDGSAQRSNFDVIERAEATDDHTVTLHLREEYALLFDMLFNPVRHMLPQEVMTRDGGLEVPPVIGSGPFVYERFERGGGFSATRNPNYFMDGVPYLDSYEMIFTTDAATTIALFRAGDVHYFFSTSTDTANSVRSSNPEAQYVESPASHSVFSPAMNIHTEPFNDVRVRRAMSMAIDRQGTVDNLYGGLGITGWGVPWAFVQDEPWTTEQLGPWHEYDPQEARQLLDAAGYGDGFSTTMMYHGYFDLMESQIQLFQAELLQHLGIEMQLQPRDYTSWFDSYAAMEWDGMAWGFQIGLSQSIDDFMFQNMHSQADANYYYIEDADIDQLVESIRVEPDVEVRSSMIAEVFQIDQDQMYRLHTPYWNSHIMANPRYHGWQPPLQFRGIGTYGNDNIAKTWLSDA